MSVGFALIALLVASLLGVIVVWTRAGRLPNAERFLAVHDLPASDDAMLLARTFLWRERWWRLLCAWSGLFLVSAYQGFVPGTAHLGVPHLAAAVAGSAVGVAWAARPPRRTAGDRRSASLTARSVDDFLPRRARTIEVIGVAVVGVGSFATWAIGMQRDASRSATAALLVGVAASIGFVSVRRRQRRVVEAGRPPLDPDLEGADDARRGSTVQSLHHALLSGLCCAAIAAIGIAWSYSGQLVVRYDGRVMYRDANPGASWRVAPTPTGEVVLWTTGRDDADRHVTIAPPDTGSTPPSLDRWQVNGALGQGVSAAGQATTGPLPPLASLLLLGAAIAEWSRIRRAPYQPLLRRPGAHRTAHIVPPTSPSAT